MVEIKKVAVEKIMGPVAGDQFDVKVSLFVVSSKHTRLKKIDLDNLSLEERTAKLKKWGQQNRFVAVIEIGDRIFAHTHSHHVEQLKNVENLTLNGKKITVQALTDEQARKLSTVGEAFEEYVLNDEIKKPQLEKKKAKANNKKSNNVLPHQFHSQRELISDQVYTTHLLITQMIKCDLGKIIIKSLQEYSRARREEQKRQEADDEKFDIKTSEIKKSILKSRIKNEEIQKQEQFMQTIDSDVKHTHRTRGFTA